MPGFYADCWRPGPRRRRCITLAWALGQSTDLGKVKDLMLPPIAGKITEREPCNEYLIFQGGISEVEEFIRKFHK